MARRFDYNLLYESSPVQSQHLASHETFSIITVRQRRVHSLNDVKRY